MKLKKSLHNWKSTQSHSIIRDSMRFWLRGPARIRQSQDKVRRRRDIGTAKRAVRMWAKPHINAGHMKQVQALRQNSNLLPFLEVTQAHSTSVFIAIFAAKSKHRHMYSHYWAGSDPIPRPFLPMLIVSFNILSRIWFVILCLLIIVAVAVATAKGNAVVSRKNHETGNDPEHADQKRAKLQSRVMSCIFSIHFCYLEQQKRCSRTES